MKTNVVACLVVAWTLVLDSGQGARAAERDPFVRPGSAPGAVQASCEDRGLKSLRARDLALVGVVETAEGFVALLAAPDGVTHFGRVGDRLCGAVVSAIDADGVAFEEQADTPPAATPTRVFRLRLHPE